MARGDFNKKEFLIKTDTIRLVEYLKQKLLLSFENEENQPVRIEELREQENAGKITVISTHPLVTQNTKTIQACSSLMRKIAEDLPEDDIEPLLHTLEQCPSGLLKEIEQDFYNINFLSSKSGRDLIIHMAKLDEKLELPVMMQNIKGLQNQVLWTFLNHRDIFEAAYTWYEVENFGRWTERKGFEKKRFTVSEDLKNLFAERVSKFYQETQARGKYCHVDVYDHEPQGRICIYAYPEDVATMDIGFSENGTYERSIRKPAFRVVFLFYPEEGRLKIKADGGKKVIQPLQVLFASTFLNQEIPLEDPKDDRIFNLNLLKNRNLPKPVPAEDRVQSINVRMLRIEYTYDRAKRITLEGPDDTVLYDTIDELKMPLHFLNITQARITVKFPGKGKRGSLTFQLTSPNNCNLGDSEQERKVREYLKAWGIDRG